MLQVLPLHLQVTCRSKYAKTALTGTVRGLKTSNKKLAHLAVPSRQHCDDVEACLQQQLPSLVSTSTTVVAA